VNVRPERAEDAVAIRDILLAAFPDTAEADLVERLRRDGDLTLALVAENSGRIDGYAAFPKLTVEDAGGIHGAAGLAPIAVRPDWQRLGIGGTLIREGHRLLFAQGCSLVFVLGDPAYYVRFGFERETAATFGSIYAGPHFMALRLSARAPRAGTVRYPAAFDQLG
jgi:putative acetyltransferase